MKGALLNERQVARVVDLLRKNEVIFDASVIEMSVHPTDQIAAHRAQSAEGLTINLKPDFHPNVREAAWRLRRQLEGFKDPAYLQSLAAFDLVTRVIEHGPLYFCQRNPRELGRFEWVIDAKGAFDQETPWEKWWLQVLLPIVQARSLRQPGGRLIGGDYSHFARFTWDEVPDYLADMIPASGHRPGLHIDLGKLLRECTRFSPDPEPGLEMVDIVTNAARRALVGNLQESGWRDIPRLMIHQKQCYLHMLLVGATEEVRVRLPYAHVLKRFEVQGRSMMTTHLRLPDEEDRYRTESTTDTEA